MISSPKYKILLRTLFSSILSSKLTASDLRFLAAELRKGQLTDELAYMLDQATRHLIADEVDESGETAVGAAERLVRQRKLSRTALSNILQSLGATPSAQSTTIRTLLRNFVAEASPSRIRKLLEVLDSPPGQDEFLSGISSTRK